MLKIEDKNKILEDGYLSAENGFYHFDDRSAYVAVLTKMPNATVEMIDWWFWWQAKESLRYRIWYPEMHYEISWDFGNFYNDESKTYRERLHLSKHIVTEDIGTGKAKIVIKFMRPEEFGFNKDKLKKNNEGTIICAKVGDLTKKVWHTRICHAVIKAEKGVEMRSRFWMANKVERMDNFGQRMINAILNKSFVKRKLLPKNLGKHMFIIVHKSIIIWEIFYQKYIKKKPVANRYNLIAGLTAYGVQAGLGLVFAFLVPNQSQTVVLY